MKDHVGIGHLTKFDAFRLNTDHVNGMDFETWFNILINIYNFEAASPKTI